MWRSKTEIALIGCVILTGLFVVLWGVTMFTSIGIFSLGGGRSLRMVNGAFWINHTYAFDIAPAVSQAQWHQAPLWKGGPPAPQPRGFPIPWYSSGHIMGYSGPDDDSPVRPANYSILIIPFWVVIIPLGVLGWCLLLRWRKSREMALRGFPVQVASPASTP